jgi:phosphonopyruvate decarboxylase
VSQLQSATFYEGLTRGGVRFFAGVPDSLLKDFCAYVTDTVPADQHVITANEGSAIALAAGRYLGAGDLGLVYMQNSGLGNTVNPLTSLTDDAVYGIPMLLLIGWRGEPGKSDEPQHVKMGVVTTDLLDAIGVPWEVLPAEDAAAAALVERAIASARQRNAPFALVVRKGTFAPYKLQSAAPDAYPTTREAAIEAFLDAQTPGALIVSTTGMPSRELFEHRERRGERHDTDFLTVGCMGHASQIALGVALANPQRTVYCLDGDGAALMHLGGLATIGTLGPANYKHVILNNGAHDSVGGQPTVGFEVDLVAVAQACGYRATFRATDAESIAEGMRALDTAEGPALLEVRVRKGSRKDLGRPTMSPRDLREAFMAEARGDAGAGVGDTEE